MTNDNEFKWNHIITAPREGRFDVWAKRWMSKTDTFEYRRFTNCFWRATHIANVPKEWSATHWCPVLDAPEGYENAA